MALAGRVASPDAARPVSASGVSLDGVRGPFEDPVAHSAFLQRLAVDLVGRGSDADDLAQDAWVELLRSDRAVRDPRPFSRGVLRNLFWRSLRRPRPSQVHDVEADGDPSLEHEREELRADVRAAVDELPDREAEVVRLRYFEGLSARAVAARSGRPLKTVQGQLARAQERIRDRLQSRWGEDEQQWTPALLLAAGATREQARRVAGGAVRGFGGTARWAAAAALLVTAAALVLRPSHGDEEPTVHAAAPAKDAPSTPTAEPRTPARVAVTRPSTPTAPAAADASGATWTVGVVDSAGTGVAAQVFTTDPFGRLLPLGRVAAGERLELDPRELAAEADTLVLRALAADHAASPEYFVPLPPASEAADAASRRELRLVVEPGAATVRGRALRADGAPAAGADVWLLQYRTEGARAEGDVRVFAGPLWTRADDDGRFEVGHLGPGDWSVQVEAAGHVVELGDASVRPGDVVEVNLQLERAARLVGVVRDGAGAPVEGARVRANGHRPTRGERTSARSGADGRFELDGVEPGHRPVVAQLEDDPELVAHAFLDCPAGTEVVWDPVLGPSSGLRVRAVDAAGEPLAGWTVRVMSDPAVAYSWYRIFELDEFGTVTIHDHPDEPLDAHLFGPGDGLALPYLTRRGFDPGAGELVLRIDVPREPGRVLGRIVDPAGAAWSGSVVLCDIDTTSPHVAPTDAAGAFVLERVPARSFQMLAMAGSNGFADLGLVAGRSGRDVDVGTRTLPAAGTLRTLGGWPESASYSLAQVPGAAIGWIPVVQASGRPPETWELLPGTYSIFRSGGTAPPAGWSFEILSGEEAVVDLDAGD